MNNTVLLDTGIVGGIFSKVNKITSAWTSVVEETIKTIPGSRYVVPTPVWYEIAQWNTESHQKIRAEIEAGCGGIFQYANHTVTPAMFMDAAWYKCHCRQPTTKNPDINGVGKAKDKISMVDALIGAYSLSYGYYVLTLNAQDFPEKFFEILFIKNAPSSTEYQRDFIYLLKPKLSEWQKTKIAPTVGK